MACNRTLQSGIVKAAAAAVLTVFLTVSSASAALALTGEDTVAGTVPQLLTAVNEKNARSHECTFGDAVADAVRISLGADIAIICGGDLVRNLLPGDITYGALKATFKEDRALAAANVTPKELRAILEAGLSHITLDETETIDNEASAYDGFPQISGFTMSYDASAPPGERVYEIRVDGRNLDLKDDATVLRLASTGHMLGGGYGLPIVPDAAISELTLSGAIVQYMNRGMAAYTETGLRIYPMGAQDGSLKAMIPIGLAVVVIFLIMLGNGQRLKRMYDFER